MKILSKTESKTFASTKMKVYKNKLHINEKFMQVLISLLTQTITMAIIQA